MNMSSAATGGIRRTVFFGRRNPLVVIGASVLSTVILVSLIGTALTNPDDAKAAEFDHDLPPSVSHWLGTDTNGKDMFRSMVEGTPRTLRIGLVAASIGLGIGVTFGFITGYFGGAIDALARTAADVMITIPGLLILVVLAITLQRPVDANLQALIIGGLTWMWPLRAIRAQVLTMRERQYVSLAKLSGASPFDIMFGEIMPNLLPYLAANFVAAVSIAILITIGMDVLGLGPQNEITLGNILYWAIFFTAPVRGIWWWWVPPIAVLMFVFIGLYLFSAGLDQVANPKLRKTA